MRWMIACVVLGGACSQGASTPAADPCRAELVTTLDDQPLAFDRRFGFRTAKAQVLVLFAGDIRSNGLDRARPPTCADALGNHIGVDKVRIEASPPFNSLAYDLSRPMATGFMTDIKLPCHKPDGSPCSQIRMRPGPPPPAGKLSRCLDVTAHISDGSSGKHVLRLIGRVEADDCGAVP